MKVKNISGGDITAGLSVVYAGETFDIAPGHFPFLVTQYGKDAFKVIDGVPAELPTEQAPDEFAVGDVAPAKIGRPKKL